MKTLTKEELKDFLNDIDTRIKFLKENEIKFVLSIEIEYLSKCYDINVFQGMVYYEDYINGKANNDKL